MSPGFFADGGSAAQGEFLKAASALRESYRFAHTNVEDLLKEHDDDGEYVAFLSVPSSFGFSFAEKFISFPTSNLKKRYMCILQGCYFVPASSSQQQI